MTISEIDNTIAALNIIKTTIECDYQVDIDKAIEGLEELKAIKNQPTCGKCMLFTTDACPYRTTIFDGSDTDICKEYLAEEEA